MTLAKLNPSLLSAMSFNERWALQSSRPTLASTDWLVEQSHDKEMQSVQKAKEAHQPFYVPPSRERVKPVWLDPQMIKQVSSRYHLKFK